ncbi:hypothetical protein B296_00006086 [Ensete ventricosum]|uniref:Uncharacterized protein n=1 Tax=Ensete ventricosum TaxID=4639 RepID=A0A426YWG4_ENSVE|nr:hypothetical protein B296_00006086 [Ensete ventricosum]
MGPNARTMARILSSSPPPLESVSVGGSSKTPFTVPIDSFRPHRQAMNADGRRGCREGAARWLDREPDLMASNAIRGARGAGGPGASSSVAETRPPTRPRRRRANYHVDWYA